MTAVLDDPAKAADHLLHNADLFGVVQAKGRCVSVGAAILELTLRPLPALAAEGYPMEQVRLVVVPPSDRVQAYPRASRDRDFKHRNPGGDLCLQYHRDDPAPRWVPDDGLELLVTLVHRHLLFEEAWRRSGEWPCEDAPHGDDYRLAPHAVATAPMRRELARWRR